ncbi:MAG: hypothetical protein WCK27_21770, partial [Verrucomicrobiota bacterium]
VLPLRENQLQLQDKGFFSAAAWHKASTQKAFLLCPLPHAVSLWQPGPTGSLLRLDVTESAHPCRVQCEIWARLLAAVLIFW